MSHSHRRTRRRWNPNAQRRRLWLAAERRHVRLDVSTTGLKIIDRDGIDVVVARLRAREVRSDGQIHRGTPGDQAAQHSRHRIHLRHPQEPLHQSGPVWCCASTTPARRRHVEFGEER
jgi:large subunit ribosomal protein L28